MRISWFRVPLRLTTRLGAAAALLCAVILPAALPSASAEAATSRLVAKGSAGIPTVSENLPGTGQYGHPWLSVPTVAVQPIFPTINLAQAGYVEREFLLSGTANEYHETSLWGSNGVWPVTVSTANVPYTVRILVRYPTTTKFSGNVVFEWLNETNGFEADPVWAQTYQGILARGDAYVGVDAQAAGGKFLSGWDPQRYGSLTEADDAQSYDIFTQAAQAVVADKAQILGGLTPQRLIATGDSQSAFCLVTYANAFQPLTHEFSAFMLVGRSAGTEPLYNGAPPVQPAFIRTDSTAQVMVVNSEDDIMTLGAGAARQSDSPTMRTWEVAGASHVDYHEAAYELAVLLRDLPASLPQACVFGQPFVINGVKESLPDNMPLYRVENAALTALVRWTGGGAAPAHGTPLTTVGPLDTILRDSYGNALGGVRLPEINVPTEAYSAQNLAPLTATNEIGLCLFFGYFTPFTTQRLQSLYPTNAVYMTQYVLQTGLSEAAGFLTPADAQQAISDAAAQPIP